MRVLVDEQHLEHVLPLHPDEPGLRERGVDADDGVGKDHREAVELVGLVAHQDVGARRLVAHDPAHRLPHRLGRGRDPPGVALQARRVDHGEVRRDHLLQRHLPDELRSSRTQGRQHQQHPKDVAEHAPTLPAGRPGLMTVGGVVWFAERLTPNA
ncbi:hypothetical protein [Calidithermus chliarophilus]|uniref:hypothetical protein n=1 Tax=Calidithermus chliarophilus TaxID=52023 RepID=UPI0012F6E502|nr:hypothetical protein [Calidithermus chliarophilus]